ncbi:MAG: bifunctional precorrin-2 dehydrogenase/sirohydrochlorin ferrochelatase [Archaeoglobaceae archaeon]|nr:bifunctional precorrin-2 dehydrogenase/sirohydrochlorin ferrochelatase [Archaeoglobaceae archaeon]MCX8152581.1 bifunctional precorrin-2 dehydrogenase/sirohydrochlorin ferrochelatase [Archaeoglobaceae archaeon]MDW8014137.1 bifunctional precorrin-2 dehydrogenase/sirohydrochlorin ferrochelatase [Archaeoglobaceae archaeon]
MRIPMFIEFSGKNVAVIGGGGVGTSRAKKFVEAGAKVTIYSLEFSEELKILEKEGKISLVKVDAKELNYEEVLKNYDLVVVAIGDLSLNEKIVEAARKNKTLVNLANDAVATEIVIPFEGNVDGIRFAITTEGKSGVVARKVKEIFEEVLRNRKDIRCFLEVMDFIKKYMKENNIPIKTRMKVYPSLSSNKEFQNLVFECRRDEAIEFAKNYVNKIIKEKIKLEKVIEF